MADTFDYLTKGWSAFESPEQAAKSLKVSDEERERRAQRLYDEDRIIRECFTQGTGPEALEILRSLTVDQPAFNPEIPVNAEYFGFLREGQNSLIREIEKRIARAERGPPTVNRPEQTPEQGE